MALVLLLAVLGFFGVSGSGDASGHSHLGTFLLVWVLLYALMVVLALVSTVRAVVGGRLHSLARNAVLVKLSGIPFFVLNFLLLATVLGVATLLGGGVAVLFAAPLLMAATYAVMLPTSMFGIGCLVLLWRRRAVTTSFVVVNTILHLLFVTDIVSSLVVAHRARADRTVST